MPLSAEGGRATDRPPASSCTPPPVQSLRHRARTANPMPRPSASSAARLALRLSGEVIVRIPAEKPGNADPGN